MFYLLYWFSFGFVFQRSSCLLRLLIKFEQRLHFVKSLTKLYMDQAISHSQSACLPTTFFHFPFLFRFFFVPPISLFVSLTLLHFAILFSRPLNHFSHTTGNQRIGISNAFDMLLNIHRFTIRLSSSSQFHSFLLCFVLAFLDRYHLVRFFFCTHLCFFSVSIEFNRLINIQLNIISCHVSESAFH